MLDVGTSSGKDSSAEAYSFEQHYVFLSGHIVCLSEPLPIFKKLREMGKIGIEDFKKLELALQEAIANAVEHGNLELSSTLREELDEQGKDRYEVLKEQRLKDNRYASRLVFVSAFANDNELKVTVRDEGNGFVDSRNEGTNILETDLGLPRCSGRGLIIIRAAADSVKFNKAGNQVEFTKRFSA